MADIMKEALILERLSPSPRVIDIYGYCGTTVILEAMASDLHTKIIIDEGAFSKEGVISQKKLDKLQEDDVYPLNNFTTSEKLQISLDMAESLADIHGFEGGPIIHADTHIEQWLIAPDGRIKFNDFNNARLPSWDAKEKKYCERTSYYGGTWRSPEEYIPSPQDESIDVYAYGNNIYTLLTGLWPYYDEYSHEISESDIKRQIVAGKRPFVDPRYRTRSVIEKGLVKIMEKCWAQEREDRPTSYELVKYMRRLKAEAVHVGELKESSLIKIPIPRGLR